MRIARFSLRRKIGYGIIQNNLVYSLEKDPFSEFQAGREPEMDGQSFTLEQVKLLAPCLPSKLVCLGLNYKPHAQEFKQTLPPVPLLFLKPSTAVIGPEDNIVLPRSWKRVDYEGELAIVIGKKARYVSENEALKYVLGYTCVNDVTERELQKQDVQWTRAKGFDTFAPLGPWIETDINAGDLKLESYLNGELRQSARTSELIFGIPRIISFISEVMTLLPGDVIATGTPAGIAPMQPGDKIEIRIENIGILRNIVMAPS